MLLERRAARTVELVANSGLGYHSRVEDVQGEETAEDVEDGVVGLGAWRGYCEAALRSAVLYCCTTDFRYPYRAIPLIFIATGRSC